MDYLVHHAKTKLDSQVQFVYAAHVATNARTPARRLTARGAATKARIVAAAASLVYERGIAGTSLDDVMAATGTSKSQLYHYFADKDALIHEVIKAQLGRIFTAQQAAGWSLTQSLRADLARHGITVHGVFPGAVDTDMIRSFTLPKTPAIDVARAVLDGVEAGTEDIFPDPMAQQLYAAWRQDHKAVERQLAAS